MSGETRPLGRCEEIDLGRRCSNQATRITEDGARVCGLHVSIMLLDQVRQLTTDLAVVTAARDRYLAFIAETAIGTIPIPADIEVELIGTSASPDDVEAALDAFNAKEAP